MTVKEIVIKNPTGLHARPASEFTRCAAGFKSKITVNRPGEKPVNAKSIISADGEDEQKAVDTLAALADSFSE